VFGLSYKCDENMPSPYFRSGVPTRMADIFIVKDAILKVGLLIGRGN
jgi:hypothetical protein